MAVGQAHMALRRSVHEVGSARPRSVTRRRVGAMWWLLVPALTIYALFFVLPLVSLLTVSVRTTSAGAEFTLEHYTDVITSAYYQGLLLNSLNLALQVSAITMVLGFLLAYAFVFVARGRSRRLFYIVVLTPLLTSEIIRAFGWLITLGREGSLNDLLIWAGVIDDPLELLFNQTGLLIGHTHVLTPFMFLSIVTVLQGIPRELDKASRDLGASGFAAFRTVVLPMSVPGLLSGLLVVFPLTISAYVVPLVLGGGADVAAIEIYDAFLFTFNEPLGAALAVVTVVPALALLALVARILRPKWQVST